MSIRQYPYPDYPYSWEYGCETDIKKQAGVFVTEFDEIIVDDDCTFQIPKELYDEYRRLNAKIGRHDFRLLMRGCWHVREIAPPHLRYPAEYDPGTRLAIALLVREWGGVCRPCLSVNKLGPWRY
jgi:hypothetical protein